MRLMPEIIFALEIGQVWFTSVQQGLRPNHSIFAQEQMST